MPTLLHQRFARRADAGLVSRLRLRSGTRADYAALAEHHYRAARPATMTRVLVLEDPTPTVAARFRQRQPLRRSARSHQPQPRDAETSGGGAGGEVVGVLVESLPALSCRMRDVALDRRYGTHLSPSERALLLNAEVRCISRVVIDPRWRGLGLAVRLVREALATATTPVTEALAAMGKVHPFFERAGMTAYPRPPHERDARLLAALNRAGLDAAALADLLGAWQTIESLPPSRRDWLLRELDAWHRQHAGRRPTTPRPPRDQLRVVRDRLGLEPVYFVKVHDRSG